VTPAHRRRRDDCHSLPDAATIERETDSTPTDAEAFQAFRVMRAWFWLGLGRASSPDVYDQDHLPPGCTSRDSYLRRHRDRLRARTPGWTTSGQLRRVDPEAWQVDVALETATVAARGAARRRQTLSVIDGGMRDVDAEIDRALGIVRPRKAAK
jgi:hypothetical protein